MVVVQLIGGIGNQMFQYACGRHLALLNNSELLLDLSFLQNRVSFRKDFVFRDYDLDIFNIQGRIATESDIPLYPQNWKINSILHRLYHLFLVRRKGFKYILERSLNSYKQILYNRKVLEKRGNIYLAGYWASPKYFEVIRDIIKADFSFRKKISNNCLDILQQIGSTNSVCINVRRKEFLTIKAMGFHGMDYIQKAVKKIEEQVTDPAFFVFSDDLEWCRANIALNHRTFFVGEEFYGEKFRDYFELMMSCKHFILPNSSFAWWAAWLSADKDKIVVTPKDYFAGYNTRDLIPDSWLRI
jgi:glycosyl transferase family 11